MSIIQGFLVPASGGPTTLVQDSYTDTNGTALSSHTPDVGVAWSVIDRSSNGTLSIQSNQINLASGAGGSGTFITHQDTGETDPTMQIDGGGRTRDGSNNNGFMGLAFGVTDTDNLWIYSGWTATTTSITWAIYDITTGSFTLRASEVESGLSSGTFYARQLKAIVSGSTVTATRDGANEISYNSYTATSVTEHGTHSFISASVSFTMSGDDYLCTD